MGQNARSEHNFPYKFKWKNTKNFRIFLEKNFFRSKNKITHEKLATFLKIIRNLFWKFYHFSAILGRFRALIFKIFPGAVPAPGPPRPGGPKVPLDPSSKPPPLRGPICCVGRKLPPGKKFWKKVGKVRCENFGATMSGKIFTSPKRFSNNSKQLLKKYFQPKKFFCLATCIAAVQKRD